MSDFSTARQKMVDGQVRPSDVTDLRILDAMLAVPREAFVPESQRALAYLDLDLDVSEAGGAKRFLIKPVVIAKMLQAAEIGGDRQRFGGRLRERICRRGGGETWRPGDGHRKRRRARRESERCAGKARLRQCDGQDRPRRTRAMRPMRPMT